MDTLGVIALGTEPPTIQVLTDFGPLARDEPVMTSSIKRNVILSALFQSGILLWILFDGHNMFELPYSANEYFYDAVTGEPTNKCIHYTMVFNSLVIQTIF